MELIIGIVLIVVLAIAIVICGAVFSKSRKEYKKNEIHIYGGANIDTGQISVDHNYFKGVTGKFDDTIVVDENNRRPNVAIVSIYNLKNGQKSKVSFSDYIIIGRNSGNNIFTIENDKLVSKQHCKLIVRSKCLYVEDMNSSNHTYLNRKIITECVPINNGDVLKIGTTDLKIVY